MHLVFLIHGLFGNHSHLTNMKESIEKLSTEKDKLVVYKAQCMSALGTFDGVVDNGNRLYEELTKKLAETKATKLSIVGYSMGGLCARYLIGVLEQANTFNTVEPVLFATFATPHLGSRYAHNTAFGMLFNLVGSRISGKSGLDLFRHTSLISKLADPTRVFYRGLKRFRHLYVFANATKDRTVHFWTAFMAPSNPFSARYLDLRKYESHPFIVDLYSSKVSKEPVKRREPRTWKSVLLNSLFYCLVPMFLAILICIMTSISLISWTKHLLNITHHGNKLSSAFMGEVGEALDETLQDNSQAEDTHNVYSDTVGDDGVPKPVFGAGYVGLVESSPRSLDLNHSELLDMDNMNRLPWKKYAVWMDSLNAHGEIVNRNNRKTGDGRSLMAFFAERVVIPIIREHKAEL